MGRRRYLLSYGVRQPCLAVTFSKSFYLLSLNSLKYKIGRLGGLCETVLLNEHSAWH